MQELSKNRRKIHPLRDALLAGVCTFVVSAVGLTILYLRARDSQVDAVRIEQLQLARVTAAQIDGDLLKTLVSPAQQGSPEHLQLLQPMVRMHRATRDIIYVYTASIVTAGSTGCSTARPSTGFRATMCPPKPSCRCTRTATRSTRPHFAMEWNTRIPTPGRTPTATATSASRCPSVTAMVRWSACSGWTWCSTSSMRASRRSVTCST